jgi:hypothetical protein
MPLQKNLNGELWTKFSNFTRSSPNNITRKDNFDEKTKKIEWISLNIYSKVFKINSLVLIYIKKITTMSLFEWITNIFNLKYFFLLFKCQAHADKDSFSSFCFFRWSLLSSLRSRSNSFNRYTMLKKLNFD